MPRAGQPLPSTLRNRNRITNKTRLKVLRGTVDSDPIIPDEDEEKNRLLQSVAGVDLDDINEHHLQAVLSEAASQNHVEQTAAFIPIPEAAGVADNYESLYPTERWKDPVSYVQSTAVIDEYTSAALADGCTYYMDERDKEWFDHNNEEARGEGTSAQGSVSASISRTTARSAKSKGKEPEEAHSILMSEDEFELVMGLFEKITQEKTEFLHHSLESGQDHFPEFSEYQQVFSVPLSPATFALYTPPSWLPQPSHLLRLARIIYPYWKERCLERGGWRIIPRLNFDEADILNESYVCFRRREKKAVRKTRASQVTSSDKLARLQTELEHPLQLAKQLLAREQLKRDSARQSQVVWDLRMKLVDMKVKNPTLGDKADDELLVDRERKYPSRVRIPVKTDAAAQPSTATRDILRPRDRLALYQSKIDALLQDYKEKDQSWDDHVDSGYVPTLQPYSSRLFKYINPPKCLKRSSPDSESDVNPPVSKRPVRVRCGRGGRMFIDRRLPASHTNFAQRRRILTSDDEDDSMDVDQTVEDPEADRRLSERWRFDSDDNPPNGPSGSEEQDRVLVDDFDVKYMSRVVGLLGESDYSALMTDHTISRITADGKREVITPFRLGVMSPMSRPGGSRGSSSRSQSATQGAYASTAAGSRWRWRLPQQCKVFLYHSSSSYLLPVPTQASGSGLAGAVTPSPVPAAASSVIPSPQFTHNGVGRAAMNMPRVDMMKSVFNHNAGSASFPLKTETDDGQQIPRPKSQQQVHMQPHQQDQAQVQAQALTSVNGLHPGYAALANANPAAYNISRYIPQSYSTNLAGLNTQQVQHLKSVFNAANAGSATNYNSALLAQMQMSKNTNTVVDGTSAAVPSSNGGPQYMPNLAPAMNLKLPPVRQRATSGDNANRASLSPRPPSTVNGVQNSLSPRMMHAMVPGEHVPPRTPSANGSRNGLRPPVVNNGKPSAHGQQPILQLHSQSPKPAYMTNSSQSYSLSQSPPKMQPGNNMPVGSL
ncbi:hypothetical protein BT96DRAFT_316208 [Gymnopus androsaceus JB14]|uniref:Enhancer of polycomb-like protein n=1 Tax=Gymnopus androsaceus JB14 TaxID=1447944 RepID=A0A6A4I5A3_9AGAR|nr:hypothetical protein BT96DRAFT_316208 [Gymnopus androsaceus JB14]